MQDGYVTITLACEEGRIQLLIDDIGQEIITDTDLNEGDGQFSSGQATSLMMRVCTCAAILTIFRLNCDSTFEDRERKSYELENHMQMQPHPFRMPAPGFGRGYAW